MEAAQMIFYGRYLLSEYRTAQRTLNVRNRLKTDNNVAGLKARKKKKTSLTPWNIWTRNGYKEWLSNTNPRDDLDEDGKTKKEHLELQGNRF